MWMHYKHLLSLLSFRTVFVSMLFLFARLFSRWFATVQMEIAFDCTLLFFQIIFTSSLHQLCVCVYLFCSRSFSPISLSLSLNVFFIHLRKKIKYYSDEFVCFYFLFADDDDDFGGVVVGVIVVVSCVEHSGSHTDAIELQFMVFMLASCHRISRIQLYFACLSPPSSLLLMAIFV